MTKVKTIGIGADHRGFKLKEKLKDYLTKLGYRTIDFGVYSADRADYPLIAFALAQHIKEVPKAKSPKLDYGILICGSGLGMSIAANKVKGIRAALCVNSNFAQRARQHNNANILVLAADFTNISEAKKTAKVFLTEQFLGDRHKIRINQITNYENKQRCGIIN
ncbi:MAG: ribose 5-phosphate isomerase B [candidate division WOR-3 bacterium]|nr:ribose 5-phosphate isomerase B [candidate division WOR-3 bacterium]